MLQNFRKAAQPASKLEFDRLSKEECYDVLQLNGKMTSMSNPSSSKIPEQNATNHEIKSLQDQLKRMDSCRQSYQMCLQEVLQFLQKAYHNLEVLDDKLKPNSVVIQSMDDTRRSQLPKSATIHDFSYTTNTLPRPTKSIKFLPDEMTPQMLAIETQSFIRIINNVLNAVEKTLLVDKQTQFLEMLRREFLCPSPPSSSPAQQLTLAAPKPDAVEGYCSLAISNEIESGFSSLSSSSCQQQQSQQQERNSSGSLSNFLRFQDDLNSMEKIRNSTVVSKKGEIYV